MLGLKFALYIVLSLLGLYVFMSLIVPDAIKGIGLTPFLDLFTY